MQELSLETRLFRLEARESIRTLVARYCVVMDDHDVGAIGDLFTQDAVFRSLDGVMQARGRESIVELFIERFRALGISNHFTHDPIISFDDDDPFAATGLINSHAEAWRNGRALIGAMRYHDVYRCDEGVWRFQSRELAFQYYLPVEEYAQAMGGRLRQRAYGDQRPADYPEGLPGWRDYRHER